MGRRIKINGTNKIVKVQKQGKKTVLELTTLEAVKRKSESFIFMFMTPIIMPLSMGIVIAPTLAKTMLEGNFTSGNTMTTFIASIPAYVSIVLLLALTAIALFASFTLSNFFSRTETSNAVLSSENKIKVNNDQRDKRAVVNENLMDNSATSIVQIALTKFYPEMTNELNKTQDPRIIDRSFSNIFNQNAA